VTLLILGTNSSSLSEIVIPTGARHKWRDLLSLHIPIADLQGGAYPKLCHPERSRGTCGAPSPQTTPYNPVHPPPPIEGHSRIVMSCIAIASDPFCRLPNVSEVVSCAANAVIQEAYFPYFKSRMNFRFGAIGETALDEFVASRERPVQLFIKFDIFGSFLGIRSFSEGG
jgi:hypothetical protein